MEQNANVDIQWSSSNKMEGCEVLKTMECLRRRLLAERQASLLAKEEAELMGKRSTELEKQITEQIQMKTKADKKLQSLRKRLESLNLSPAKVNSEPSICSDEPSVEDSLAMVAVKSPENEEIGELKPAINEGIVEVLNDLKVARERIQSSLEICELNLMKKVSPI